MTHLKTKFDALSWKSYTKQTNQSIKLHNRAERNKKTGNYVDKYRQNVNNIFLQIEMNERVCRIKATGMDLRLLWLLLLLSPPSSSEVIEVRERVLCPIQPVYCILIEKWDRQEHNTHCPLHSHLEIRVHTVICTRTINTTWTKVDKIAASKCVANEKNQ